MTENYKIVAGKYDAAAVMRTRTQSGKRVFSVCGPSI